MKPIVTGVVGYGFSGRIFHCPFVDAHELFELKAVVSRSSDEPLKKYPYIDLLRDYETLLNDTEIELVIITTPSHLHFEHAKMALNKGKHVLVEKPYTSTYAEAIELNSLADEKGLFISAYQNRRYDGDFLTLKKLKEDGLLDKIYDISFTWDRYKMVDKINWKESGQEGSNLVYDLGSHLLDQILTLFGEPIDTYSKSKIIRENSRIKDWFMVVLDYGEFVLRLKSTLAGIAKEPRYSIQTNKGAFVFKEMGEQEHQLLAGMSPLDVNYGDNAMYDLVDLEGNISKKQVIKGNYLMYYTQMFNAIRKGATPEVTKEEAALLIKYLEKI